VESLLRLDRVPTSSNRFFDSAEAAWSCAVGSVDLGICLQCGLIQNASFDPSLIEYSDDYENSLHHSATFQQFALETAAHLVDEFDARGRQVLEIGPGSGDFLAMLRRAGAAQCVGFDPSYRAGRTADGFPDGVTIEARAYPLDREVDAALVVARHVLEHVTEPLELLRAVRQTSPPAGVGLYLEVPDATYMVESKAYWDVIYEHVTYFAAPTLAWITEEAGFAVERTSRVFGDQYLAVEARAGHQLRPEIAPQWLEAFVGAARVFGQECRAYFDRWEEELATLMQRGPVALWGAGSKGVTLATVLPSGCQLAHVIDVNPTKQGRHVPVTGQTVASPSVLGNGDVATVVVMNPLYLGEIAQSVAELSPTTQVVGAW
jgi:SAM-dependent methyltransferase